MLLKAQINRIIFYVVVLGTILYAEAVFAETVILGPGKIAKQEDVSYKFSFADPAGFEEDKLSAENNGLIKIYIPKGKKIEDSVMIITVAFKKKATSGFKNLDDFIKNDIDSYRALYNESKIDIANLSSDVTDKFQNEHIPFMAVLFKSNSNKTIADAIVLFLETPDGFWSISYTTSQEILYKTRNLFLAFVKSIVLVKR